MHLEFQNAFKKIQKKQIIKRYYIFQTHYPKHNYFLGEPNICEGPDTHFEL